jgi:hypothetical protein
VLCREEAVIRIDICSENINISYGQKIEFLREECRLRVFENRVLRGYLGPRGMR